jgi:hypothetical protein
MTFQVFQDKKTIIDQADLKKMSVLATPTVV